jgi:predicted CXXCH cytochrome family protein
MVAAMHAMRMQLVVFLGCASMLAHGELNCGVERNVDPTDMGPSHHPIGKSLPQRAEFNQPTRCADGGWFFDLNRNATPDAGEPRLFGPLRVVECSSCHADSPDAKTEASASVFLRQDANKLCLVCHNV